MKAPSLPETSSCSAVVDALAASPGTVVFLTQLKRCKGLLDHNNAHQRTRTDTKTAAKAHTYTQPASVPVTPHCQPSCSRHFHDTLATQHSTPRHRHTPTHTLTRCVPPHTLRVRAIVSLAAKDLTEMKHSEGRTLAGFSLPGGTLSTHNGGVLGKHTGHILRHTGIGISGQRVSQRTGDVFTVCNVCQGDEGLVGCPSPRRTLPRQDGVLGMYVYVSMCVNVSQCPAHHTTTSHKPDAPHGFANVGGWATNKLGLQAIWRDLMNYTACRNSNRATERRALTTVCV